MASKCDSLVLGLKQEVLWLTSHNPAVSKVPIKRLYSSLLPDLGGGSIIPLPLPRSDSHVGRCVLLQKRSPPRREISPCSWPSAKASDTFHQHGLSLRVRRDWSERRRANTGRTCTTHVLTLSAIKFCFGVVVFFFLADGNCSNCEILYLNMYISYGY